MASLSTKIACFAGGFILYHFIIEHGGKIKQTKDTLSRTFQNAASEYGICEGSDCIDVDMPCSNAMRITRDFKKLFEIELFEANANGADHVIHDYENILNSRIKLASNEIIMNEQYYVSHNENNDIRILMQFLVATGFKQFDTYKGEWDLIEIDNGNRCRVCNVGKHYISSRWIRQLPSFRDSSMLR